MADVIPPESPIEVTPELQKAAREVLWFFRGYGDNSSPPSGFFEQLITTLCRADPENLGRMYLAFPEHTLCVNLAKNTLTGIDQLKAWASDA